MSTSTKTRKRKRTGEDDKEEKNQTQVATNNAQDKKAHKKAKKAKKKRKSKKSTKEERERARVGMQVTRSKRRESAAHLLQVVQEMSKDICDIKEHVRDIHIRLIQMSNDEANSTGGGRGGSNGKGSRYHFGNR